MHRRCLPWLLFWLVVPAAVWAGPSRPRLGPEAVWHLPVAAWSACLKQRRDAAACLRRLMERTRAGGQARDVLSGLNGEGFMSAFRPMGRVDLATMTLPGRANTNEVPYLVNGRPWLVSTELDAPPDISGDPAYPALRAAFPRLELWPSGAAFRAMDRLPDGGQRFVFAYPLLDGCHACTLGGYALIAHDFGPEGGYRGARLLGLEAAR